ncbi:MAG TPA: YtpI family protein [Cerasibacillus sp.]|uniref:YtpI family protein n=1 Tax=Cerasibacillus sp. TaxID=2498711 RepID=UPI002F413A74
MGVIFPILIVVSIVLYIYYKVAILKSKDILTQKYFNGRAHSCLGIFILTFGINQYLSYQTKISLIVGIVFILIGGAQLIHGFKVAKHYKNEWRRLNPEG